MFNKIILNKFNEIKKNHCYGCNDNIFSKEHECNSNEHDQYFMNLAICECYFNDEIPKEYYINCLRFLHEHGDKLFQPVYELFSNNIFF